MGAPFVWFDLTTASGDGVEDVQGAPATGAPEVDLGQVWSRGEELAPVAIGYAT